jgi:hypothetical protein
MMSRSQVLGTEAQLFDGPHGSIVQGVEFDCLVFCEGYRNEYSVDGSSRRSIGWSGIVSRCGNWDSCVALSRVRCFSRGVSCRDFL